VSGGPETVKPDPTGIEWVHVCPGTFSMGTIKGEDKMAFHDEIVDPARTVVLRAFQITATETTQQEYGKEGDLPVVNIDWTEARAFCRRVGGDLPTEAQWEYAARGGSRFPWSFGDDEAQLGNYAWFSGDIKTAQKVGLKRPNPLGLYDMHGNVWEWTWDWYNAYASGVFVDPLGPGSSKCPEVMIRTLGESATCRVVRGGSFVDPPEALRAARRGGGPPVLGGDLRGFRCVRVPPQP
jgi:formylglycine-generating enzyme required for sulfatase activity